MGEHFAKEYSLIMGIVDLIPVILFALAGCIIIKVMFNKEKINGATVAVSTTPLLILTVLVEPAKQVDGSIAFIAMLVVGEIMIATTLCFLAVKNKRWICLALFIVSFICLMVMVAMKPLSSKMNMSVTTANWVEESVNVLAQLSLLVGCYLLNKAGFFAYLKENK